MPVIPAGDSEKAGRPEIRVMDAVEKPIECKHMKIYVEEYAGYTASIYERDGKWWVQPALRPDGVSEERAIGKPTDPTSTSERSSSSLIDVTALSEWPADSLEKAKSAAHKQLEDVVGKAFDAEWKEKG